MLFRYFKTSSLPPACFFFVHNTVHGIAIVVDSMDSGSDLVLYLTLEMYILLGFSTYCHFSTLDMGSLKYLQNIN